MVQTNNKLVRSFREENTPEYEQFKAETGEDELLVERLTELEVTDGTVLYIGGRDVPISSQLTGRDHITLVEPDPIPHPRGVKKYEGTIQTFLEYNHGTFDIILCSHVLGDLGRQNAQADVVKELTERLTEGGKLVLAYNQNTGVLRDLLGFAEETLDTVRYDYFNEAILDCLDADMRRETFTVTMAEDTFYDLGVMCWVLFGTGEDDIDTVAKRFEPVLRAKLNEPKLTIQESLVIIS
jgi:SAM-dependent methyltransferase